MSGARTVGRAWACFWVAVAALALTYAPVASADPAGPSSVVKTAVFSTSCNTTTCTVVAGVASKRLRVWYAAVSSVTSAQTMKLCTGPSSCVSQHTDVISGGTGRHVFGGGAVQAFTTTSDGAPLVVTTTASGQATVFVVYTEVTNGTEVVSGPDSPVTVSGTVAVSGPLTDAQLRATPVPVNCSSGCSGGGGSGGDVTIADVTDSDLLELIDGTFLAAGLTVFCLGALVVLGFRRR